VICNIKSYMQLKRASYTLLWKRRKVSRNVVKEVVAKEKQTERPHKRLRHLLRPLRPEKKVFRDFSQTSERCPKCLVGTNCFSGSSYFGLFWTFTTRFSSSKVLILLKMIKWYKLIMSSILGL